MATNLFEAQPSLDAEPQTLDVDANVIAGMSFRSPFGDDLRNNLQSFLRAPLFLRSLDTE